MYLHPNAANVRIWTVESGSASAQNNYDVLVVLSTALHQEDHLRLTMEQREKDKPLYLVRAENEWDLVLGKPSGPCKTCEWERMRARSLELQKQHKMVENSEDRCLPEVNKLLKLEEIAEVLNKAYPELRKKAFSQFLVNITRELRVSKTPSSDTSPLVCNALRIKKTCQEDLDQMSEVFQPRDVTDHPSKVLSVLTALEHFRLDVGLLGQTGCSSSSLFNSLLGLLNGDNGIASTGVTETTQEPVAQPYPECSNVLLWDLPGWGRVGNLKIPPDGWRSHQDPALPSNLPICDVYILLSPLRLSLRYIQLCQHLLSLGKGCYLVLSKADLIEASAGEVRRWTEEVLEQLGLKQNVFLVSALHPETMDFHKLREVLNTALPNHKKAALASYVTKLLEQDVFWKRADPCKLM
ncbi:interferon-inducible GTPase 5 [Electrophorus electricus]|uniref:interferon-inducible GTPase 5 n=1 Tax=Electrophorus electricus TaxID=8005 RepID=UPI0015D08218|nr:interferon-inducible GTPase 5 [Electrophorus electricus]